MDYRYSADELNQARIWNAYAGRDYLQSTIDPRDAKGLKCDYIDRWSQHYVAKFVLEGCRGERPDVIEIGCGAGRNLFALAPRIGRGFGVDVAEKQIANAERIRGERDIRNVSFYTDPNVFFREGGASVRRVFTMWVLAGFDGDDDLVRMLTSYRASLPAAERFVFFEQAAPEERVFNEDGQFYKKVRTRDGYAQLLERCGLRLAAFHVLSEKGFGPLYRLLYGTRLYRSWPRRLNLNALLFPLDRAFVRREIAAPFTDCAMVCEVAA